MDTYCSKGSNPSTRQINQIKALPLCRSLWPTKHIVSPINTTSNFAQWNLLSMRGKVLKSHQQRNSIFLASHNHAWQHASLTCCQLFHSILLVQHSTIRNLVNHFPLLAEPCLASGREPINFRPMDALRPAIYLLTSHA